MSRSLEREMNAEVLPIWKKLDLAMKNTIRRTVTQIRNYGADVTLDDGLILLERQCLPGDSLAMARCAATGLFFMPAGLMRPFFYMVDPDKGYMRPNMVLVCHGYYLLRKSTRVGGEEGHARVVRWVEDFNDAPRRSMLDHWIDHVDPE